MLMDLNSSRCCSFNRISVGAAVELVSFYLVCCVEPEGERGLYARQLSIVCD